MAADSRSHRIVTVRMLVVSVVVGVVLAALSVPYGTLVREAGFRGWRVGMLPGWQRGAGLGPGSDLFGSGGQWVAWPPSHEVDPTSLTSPVDIAPETLPHAARRRVRNGHERFDVLWSGYPFKCALGWSDRDGGRAWLVEWTQVRHRTIVTPLRPMWAGLLGNTLVYAALVLAPWSGVRLVRTRRRRARGRCVACGYELGEGVAVCPECGLGRAKMGSAIER